MANKIESMLDKMIESKLESIVERMFTSADALADTASEPTVTGRGAAYKGRPRTEGARLEAEGKAQRRTFQRRSSILTVYRVNVDRATARKLELRPNDQAALNALLSSRQPLTEKEVVKAIGRKDASAQNAVQSSLWFLRNHDVNGKRVKPNSKAAMVVSERPENGE